jgi:hypothetical protein
MRRLVVAVMFLLMFTWPSPAHATSAVTLEATYTSGLENGWAKVERYRDTSSGFVAEAYPPGGVGDQTGQTQRLFGGISEPHSSRFLLYQAPGSHTGSKPVPVLLVHGANQTADQAWANPNMLGPNACGSASCPSTGLMQYLDGAWLQGLRDRLPA